MAAKEAGYRMHIQIASDEFGIAAARPPPYRMRQAVEQHDVAVNKLKEMNLDVVSDGTRGLNDFAGFRIHKGPRAARLPFKPTLEWLQVLVERTPFGVPNLHGFD